MLGGGLLILFGWRLLPKLSGPEAVALSIPLGFGLNGWLVFMLGLSGHLVQEAFIVTIAIGILALLCLIRHININIKVNLGPVGY